MGIPDVNSGDTGLNIYAVTVRLDDEHFVLPLPRWVACTGMNWWNRFCAFHFRWNVLHADLLVLRCSPLFLPTLLLYELVALLLCSIHYRLVEEMLFCWAFC